MKQIIVWLFTPPLELYYRNRTKPDWYKKGELPQLPKWLKTVIVYFVLFQFLRLLNTFIGYIDNL